MSTINNTDIFLIARGTTNYQVTAADVAAYTGGGGGGVTGVTVTAPITDTGSATVPNIGIAPATSAAAGSMSAADKAKLDGAATIVSSVTGTLPITVATGTSTPVIAINAATTAATGSIQLATAAEAATGTDAAKALTPATGVPKTPADMTGAALLPGGDDSERPGTPAAGMLRYNDQGGTPVKVEYYDGSAWTQLATGGGGVGSVVAAGILNPNGMGFIFGFNVASFAGVIGTGAYQINFTTPVTGTYIVVANSGTNYSAITSYSAGSTNFIVRSGVPPSSDQSGIEFNFVAIKVS